MTVSKLKFDLAMEGLLCVLKPYQAEIMRLFWAMDETHDSRSVYNYLQAQSGDIARSRAAVINYLNYMVDEGFLDYDLKSGKGGYKRIYRLNELSETEKIFRDSVGIIVMEKLLSFTKGEG